MLSRTCQGTAAVSSDSPSLTLTGRHSDGAVMALCKLILLWLSHQLQWEWSFLPCRNGRTSWWMMAAEEKGKTLCYGWGLWKVDEFWPAFSSLAGFQGGIISRGVKLWDTLFLYTPVLPAKMSGSWRTIHHTWGWTMQDVFRDVYVHIYLWNCTCHCKQTSVGIFISLEFYT